MLYNKIKTMRLIFLLYILYGGRNDLASFKVQMEQKVKKIATEMQEVYERRCKQGIPSCSVLSYDDCEGTSTKVCHEDFPSADKCMGKGVFMSQTSTIRFPNSVDRENLSEDEKQFVCTSALLEDSFLELDENRSERYGKAYIGSNLGSFRSYPSTRQIDPETGECPDYDPRFRPWYVSATSGSKNVILMIDISASMEGNGLEIAKAAATTVIDTLSNKDFIGVISFSNQAEVMREKKLKRATNSVKEQLVKEISDLSAKGKTNYQDALTKAFSLINTASQDEYGAPCSNGENILLFLTDGSPTLGYKTSDSLITYIEQNRQEKKITMFTYALGAGLSNSIIHDLSCEYKGITFNIKNTSSASELADIMKNYHTYISEGVTIQSPVWSEPYVDAFGFGKMVTVSMPIYYTENSIRSVLGVAGIDISLAQYFDMNEEEIIHHLMTPVPCYSSTLSECQIENLRQFSCQNQVCTQSHHQNLHQCNFSTLNVFKLGQQKGDDVCCSLSVGAFISMLIPSLLTVVCFLGFCISKIFQKSNQITNSNMQELNEIIDNCIENKFSSEQSIVQLSLDPQDEK